jgi:hypothetical protein
MTDDALSDEPFDSRVAWIATPSVTTRSAAVSLVIAVCHHAENSLSTGTPRYCHDDGHADRRRLARLE